MGKKRVYTEDAYQQIHNTIAKIQNEQVSVFTDWVGDLVSQLCQYLKIYVVENYKNDMNRWYEIVVDSHNYTLEKVNAIFGAVAGLDEEYSNKIGGESLTSIESFTEALTALSDVIGGRQSLSAAKQIAKKAIKDGETNLESAYCYALTRSEVHLEEKALEDCIGDILGLGSAYFKFAMKPENWFNPIEIKKLVDKAIGFGFDVAAIYGLFISLKLNKAGESTNLAYLDARYASLSQCEKNADNDSITNLLKSISEKLEEELAQCPEDSAEYGKLRKKAALASFGSEAFETFDNAEDVYDIYKGVTGITDKLNNWYYGKKYYDVETLLKEKPECMDWGIEETKGYYILGRDPADMRIDTVISDLTGIPVSDWDSKGLENTLKTAKTIWSYAESALHPENGSAFWKTNKVTRTLGDTGDFVAEMFTPEVSSEPKHRMRYDLDSRTWSKEPYSADTITGVKSIPYDGSESLWGSTTVTTGYVGVSGGTAGGR